MLWFRQLGLAFRNLGRYVIANPVWAAQSVVTSPLRLVRHLIIVLLLFLLAVLVLQVGTEGVLWYTGLSRTAGPPASSCRVAPRPSAGHKCR